MPNYGHGKYTKRNHMQKKHVVHRLVNKTVFEEGGCWLWQGSQDGKGYGQIRIVVGLKPERVHRISAFFFLHYSGVIYQVNHKRECSNKHCWNPDHLYIGSQQENVWDNMATGHIRLGTK